MVELINKTGIELKLEDGTAVAPGQSAEWKDDTSSVQRTIKQAGKRPAPSLPPQQERPRFRLPPWLPPGLNPKNIEGESTDKDINNMISHMASMWDAASRAFNAATAIHNDLTKTEAARHMAAAETVHRITRSAMQSAEEFHKRFVEELERRTAALMAPVRRADNAVLALEGQIRTALHAMTPDLRSSTLAAAVREGDDATMAAVLIGPAFLTGLTAAEQERWRLEWQSARHGEEMQRIAYLKKQLEHIGRGLRLFHQFNVQLWSPSAVDEARKFNEAAKRAVAGV